MRIQERMKRVNEKRTLYHRSLKGLKVDLYSGIIKKSKLRGHKLILSRETFYNWLLTTSYSDLFEIWKKSGFESSFTPSVDRLDNSKGYDISNIQLVTWAENNANGHKDWEKEVYQVTTEGIVQAKYSSIKKAADTVGVSHSAISIVCRLGGTSKGYRWVFKKDLFKILNQEVNSLNNKKVLCYSFEGKFIREYLSAKVASLALHASPSGVHRACKNFNYTCKKHRFKYKDIKCA